MNDEEKQHVTEVPRSAADLFAESLRLLLSKDMTGYAGLWAAEGVMEFPFAPAGYPSRLAGRAAIEEYLRDYPQLVDVREISDQRVHHTDDPEVVIAEFTAAGQVVATGRPYEMRYVAVLTARGGELVSYRDYWSPQAAAEILGGQEQLTTFATGNRPR